MPPPWLLHCPPLTQPHSRLPAAKIAMLLAPICRITTRTVKGGFGAWRLQAGNWSEVRGLWRYKLCAECLCPPKFIGWNPNITVMVLNRS